MNVLKTLITILLVLVFQITQAQIIVNQSWVNTTGQPELENFPLDDWDKITWSNSTIDPVGHLITVGNTLQAPGNTDILITKYNGNGQQSWQHTVDGTANGHDYGTAITTDMQGNVYVAGAVSTTNSLLDFVLLKYNSLGVLQWTSNWSGSANLYDVPTSIDVDLAGNIAIAGITVTSSLQSDIVAQKYLPDGSLAWTSYYDNVGLNELPVSVDFISGGKVAVKGFTNTSTGAWGLADVRFSDQTGTISTSNTTALPQLSIEDAFAITSDGLDNIYIAGSSASTSNKNFEVIKINPSFNIVWSSQFDGKGLQDIAKAIAVDSENNIIVSGNSDKPTEGTDILTIKLSASGQEIWRKSYMAPVETGKASVSKIQISSGDEIFLTGTVDAADGTNFTTYMYDHSGAIRMEQVYNSGNNHNDRVTDFQLFSDDEIFVTGRTEIPNYGTKYTTVKYDLLRKSNGNVLVGGEPHHRVNEIIVKFLPQFVDTTFVDDRTKRYGDIYDVLPSNVVEDIDKRTTTSFRRATAIKIFYRLSTNHTTSLTRLDETIPIPEFWSAFLLCFPAGTDMETLTDELNLIPDFIEYAELNYISTPDNLPDDTFFESDDQASLFPSDDFPNAHINVEPAWDLETGQAHTKVGVGGNVIFWAHEDLSTDGSLENSRVIGGWDFKNNVAIGNVTDPPSHETSCAGIIGAIRFNDTGIAGIAGGGLDAQGNDNSGVQLFSLGFGDSDGFAAVDVISPAIVEGAMFSPSQDPPGYGLHIQSGSWGSPNSSQLIRDAINFCFRNQCTYFASRGNAGTDVLRFPACYRDDQVISVGASGTDGEYFNGETNGNEWAEEDPGSNFGQNVDIIAPGVSELITSLINPNNPSAQNNFPEPQGAAGNYQAFIRTSAATPHAAGVAALMHSLHHVSKGQWNNLAPEDIEFLIQRYATDIINIDEGYGEFYDEFNGWGRVNAFNVIQRLEAPTWRVFHSGEPDQVQESQPTDIPVGVGGLVFKRYTITHTYQDVFSPSTQIIDSWERRSSTSGEPFMSTPDPQFGFDDWASYNFTINQNTVNVTATTYRYELVNGPSGQILESYPPQAVQTAYSLHLFDPMATSVEESLEAMNIYIHPNPSGGVFHINLHQENLSESVFRVYNSTGILVKEVKLPTTPTISFELDLGMLSNGIYFCHFQTDEGIFTKKLIKQ